MNTFKKITNQPPKTSHISGWFMLPICLDEEEKTVQNSAIANNYERNNELALAPCDQPILNIYTKVEQYEQDFYLPDSPAAPFGESSSTVRVRGQNVKPKKGVGNQFLKNFLGFFHAIKQSNNKRDSVYKDTQ
jgi:hypothetical protein